ncbi:hypothetical protein PANT_20d00072 [Moesziomyces antarcticus T-34]|uniref:Uncharacterized protein n=1 Tax=Pseudozyma antarctica (strain T-34) TaxID=1151754 RepID=M9LZC1_PSEA3|nr:hypothetical protein PANT_20d00072 [Moesziomyces antarcticus T-34]
MDHTQSRLDAPASFQDRVGSRQQGLQSYTFTMLAAEVERARRGSSHWSARSSQAVRYREIKEAAPGRPARALPPRQSAPSSETVSARPLTIGRPKAESYSPANSLHLTTPRRRGYSPLRAPHAILGVGECHSSAALATPTQAGPSRFLHASRKDTTAGVDFAVGDPDAGISLGSSLITFTNTIAARHLTVEGRFFDRLGQL